MIHHQTGTRKVGSHWSSEESDTAGIAVQQWGTDMRLSHVGRERGRRAPEREDLQMEEYAPREAPPLTPSSTPSPPKRVWAQGAPVATRANGSTLLLLTGLDKQIRPSVKTKVRCSAIVILHNFAMTFCKGIVVTLMATTNGCLAKKLDAQVRTILEGFGVKSVTLLDPPHCSSQQGRPLWSTMTGRRANAYYTRRNLLMNGGIEVQFASPGLMAERLAGQKDRRKLQQPSPGQRMMSRASPQCSRASAQASSRQLL
jgi:hypothetical protein